MRFSDVPAHEATKRLLREMADSGKIPHAILLHGPAGIGKTMLARALAQYIVCSDHSTGDCCDRCPSCLQTRAFNNPDLHYIYPVVKKGRQQVYSTDYAEEWKQMLTENPLMEPLRWLALIEAGNSQPGIYVEESDNITEIGSMSAYASKYKVFLIWQPEKMRPETANKLLKIIEEPYPDTLFIMVSNDVGAILPTILSRTRRIEVPRPSDREIAQWLCSRGAGSEEAARAASLADGSFAKALEMVDNSGEDGEFGDYFRTSMRLAYSMNTAEMRRLSDRLAALGREKNLRLLDYFGRQIRENFIFNLSNPQLNAQTDEERGFSQRFAPFINAANVETMAAETQRARNDIARNANGKIVWFDFLLKLTRLLRLKPAAS